MEVGPVARVEMTAGARGEVARGEVTACARGEVEPVAQVDSTGSSSSWVEVGPGAGRRAG